MKAAFLEKPGKIFIDEVDEPVPGDDDVLIKIQATGICGSDLHYYKEGKVGTNVVKEPHILGHESAGEVVAAGKNVNNLKIGDRVTVEPGVPCLRCNLCLTGRYNLCNQVRFLGAPPNHGTFREYLAHNALFAHKLPAGISNDEGAFVEPLAVGYNAMRKAALVPGESVLILGAGTIGLSCLQMIRIAGAGHITVFDVDEYRLKIAKKLGAHEIILNDKDAIGELRYDCVIEATGAPGIFGTAVTALQKGGRIIVVGMSNEPICVDFIALLRKEAMLQTIYRYANCYKPVLKLLETGDIRVEDMVTHHFPLTEIEEALRTADDPSIDKVKIIVG